MSTSRTDQLWILPDLEGRTRKVRATVALGLLSLCSAMQVGGWCLAPAGYLARFRTLVPSVPPGIVRGHEGMLVQGVRHIHPPSSW